MTTTETTAAPPPLPTFSRTPYGVDVTWFGEDGGMVSPGHVPDMRFIAACNHLARKDAGLRNIWDDPSARLDETLALVLRLWAVSVGPERFGYGEWAVTTHDVTGQTPGAFPLTVLWP
jgi:hypothetical protein